MTSLTTFASSIKNALTMLQGIKKDKMNFWKDGPLTDAAGAAGTAVRARNVLLRLGQPTVLARTEGRDTGQSDTAVTALRCRTELLGVVVSCTVYEHAGSGSGWSTGTDGGHRPGSSRSDGGCSSCCTAGVS